MKSQTERLSRVVGTGVTVAVTRAVMADYGRERLDVSGAADADPMHCPLEESK